MLVSHHLCAIRQTSVTVEAPNPALSAAALVCSRLQEDAPHQWALDPAPAVAPCLPLKAMHQSDTESLGKHNKDDTQTAEQTSKHNKDNA
eukprot:scaffold165307_cov15-Tisochrysis_lutea.AAC.1